MNAAEFNAAPVGIIAPALAAAIADKGIPLSADMAPQGAEREPYTLAERTAYSLRLEEDVRQLIARQRNRQTLADAAAHTHSPSDLIAYAHDAWLIGHPDVPVSTDLDYPAWAAALAAQPTYYRPLEAS